MERLKVFEQKLAGILETLLIVLFAFILVMVGLIVILRFGLNYGIVGGDELVRKAFLFTSVLGGAVGLVKREHIAVTYFIDGMARPLKLGFYVVGLGLIALVNAAMVYYAWPWMMATGFNTWQPFDLPKIIVQSAIPIGCGLAVVFCVVKIILTLGGRENIDNIWLPED